MLGLPRCEGQSFAAGFDGVAAAGLSVELVDELFSDGPALDELFSEVPVLDELLSDELLSEEPEPEPEPDEAALEDPAPDDPSRLSFL